MGDIEHRRMQVKVLYSFNDNGSVFLSRSKSLFSIKVAQIPIISGDGTSEEIVTLGGFELKNCIQQILRGSPENFNLRNFDYAVYYKDLTEQPDEPFVSNGVLSELIKSSSSSLIPGRVCQNVSANFLFGDKKDSSSLTLEVRLKFHAIDRTIDKSYHPGSDATSNRTKRNYNELSMPSNSSPFNSNTQYNQPSHDQKYQPQHQQQKQQQQQQQHQQPHKHQRLNVGNQPVKATRTKSLPAFPQPYNHIYNIRNADKLNTPSRFNSQSVQDRFKLAPFLDAQVIDKPKVVRRRRNHRSNSTVATRQNSMVEPLRAMKTRSMITSRQTPLMISSPINEEGSSDTDDMDYNDNNPQIAEEEEEEEDDDDDDNDNDEEDDDDQEEVEGLIGDGTSPYTPQQPPYRPYDHRIQKNQSLPDFEDFDSKKTHTIPSTKLPENHGLVCTNPNCSTTSSITWRYFEIEFQPNFFEIHRATEFNKKNYEGMYGPLCNACYLFLRNKGFMRPEAVVKKYLKQQQYKKENKERDDVTTNNKPHPKYNGSGSNRFNDNYGSSPIVGNNHKFVTPSHTPSEINQAIQNSKTMNNPNDLNDIMNQLNSFGGPLTDIDPLPQDQAQGVTPPMMATKANTRVINIDQDSEDKENCPPLDISQLNSSSSPARTSAAEFEKMIVKSFSDAPDQRSGPDDSHNEWMNSLFGGGTTPRDQITPCDGSNGQNGNGNQGYNNDTDNEDKSNLPEMKTFTIRRSPRLNKTKSTITTNMPSSPLLPSKQGDSDDLINDFLLGHDAERNLNQIENEINHFSNKELLFDKQDNIDTASRNNTSNLNLSLYHHGKSSPHTEIHSDDINHQKSTKDKIPSNSNVSQNIA